MHTWGRWVRENRRQTGQSRGLGSLQATPSRRGPSAGSPQDGFRSVLSTRWPEVLPSPKIGTSISSTTSTESPLMPPSHREPHPSERRRDPRRLETSSALRPWLADRPPSRPHCKVPMAAHRPRGDRYGRRRDRGCHSLFARGTILSLVLACGGCAGARSATPRWVPGTYSFLARTYTDDFGGVRGEVEVDAGGPLSVTTDKVNCLLAPSTAEQTTRSAVFDCGFDVRVWLRRSSKPPMSGRLSWGPNRTSSRGEVQLQWLANEGPPRPGGN